MFNELDQPDLSDEEIFDLTQQYGILQDTWFIVRDCGVPAKAVNELLDAMHRIEAQLECIDLDMRWGF